ncbi:hypothetical protein E1180_09350 [Roseibium denhamense]|uniref:Uncharacterized protein n=1 Tax=Roseibium denhamense TaxID=76305 RepID=A0ABY1PN08_9HYPH|nr:hypothetical protein [Roseibium denhamense]MTI05720.1 hypothetical protein [Roseibium denhamense]SMP36945.1 hypothetical protein SAMN06265374_4389 [Roseibium denhamense]
MTVICRLLLFVFALSISPAPVSAAALEFQKPQSRWEVSWLAQFYNRDFVQITGQNIDWSNPPFLTATADIDGDPGNPAIFVLRQHRDFCGAQNCTLHVWHYDEPTGSAPGAGDYVRALEVFVAGAVALGDMGPNGLQDIWLGENLWRWNGSTYIRP